MNIIELGVLLLFLMFVSGYLIVLFISKYQLLVSEWLIDVFGIERTRTRRKRYRWVES